MQLWRGCSERDRNRSRCVIETGRFRCAACPKPDGFGAPRDQNRVARCLTPKKHRIRPRAKLCPGEHARAGCAAKPAAYVRVNTSESMQLSHKYPSPNRAGRKGPAACVCVCMCACVHVCMCACVRTHVCARERMCVCVFACVHARARAGARACPGLTCPVPHGIP